MHSSVQMTLTVSLILDELVNKLLTKTVIKDGQEIEQDRVIPFRLKYRLSRNKATLDKDYKAYQQKQLMYMARYGELTADGVHFEIKDPEKLERYKQDMEAALSTIVEHTVVKLDAEDLETLNDDAGLNDLPAHMLNLLQAYLVEDEAFLQDITSEIRWNTYQPKEPTVAETVAALAQVTAEAEKKPEPKKTQTKSQARRKNISEGKPVNEGLSEELKEEAPKKTAKKKTTKKTENKKTAAEVAEVKDKE